MVPDACLSILGRPPLDKVGFLPERHHVHEVEWILRAIVCLGISQRREQAVGDEFNVLVHELGIQADQVHGHGILERCVGGE